MSGRRRVLAVQRGGPARRRSERRLISNKRGRGAGGVTSEQAAAARGALHVAWLVISRHSASYPRPGSYPGAARAAQRLPTEGGLIS